MYHNRPHVEDIRAKKRRGEKLSMLYVTSTEEAAAAAAAGIDLLSIEAKDFTPEMREAAGACFVQIGLTPPTKGTVDGKLLVSAEQFLEAAYRYTAIGGDCFYCAASFDIQRTMCENHIPIVAHVGLIPSYVTWTGWRAVGKTASEALTMWKRLKRLEEIGCFAVELEVVPGRIAEFFAKNTSMIYFSLGSGSGGDVQYLFAEDVLGYGRNRLPRHAKAYRNFKAEFDRLNSERVAAFREFRADIYSGAYPGPEHTAAIPEAEFETFLSHLGSR
ncbi:MULTISPECIES: 3-methyl-2-oxobutanoate hydroxymethyltransferase [unclassified Mesorhizobium]|uniref:3-methyl-2-oxobutanoate hydroxymethyltransferase n=2 Tax=unclassified Mesorhizobium TaxID=325217 RepID=UPI0003CE8BBC|nr:3-methyl-2-oxobutanoate hydroxymethyltransferase [Mesorhizobium sp. LSHC420B00]